MSAAPSNLGWEDWSNSFLDKNNPQVNGDNTCSIPQFWKGKALSWSRYCPGSKSSTISPGNKLVFNKTDHAIYSVGGEERIQNTATCSLKVCSLKNDSLEDDYSWDEMPGKSSVVDTDLPSERHGHCCCYYSGKIYIYGGRSKHRNNLFGSGGDLCSYDIHSGEWNDVLTFVEDCDYPMPRYGHASTTNNNSVLYIHGGHIKYDNRKFGFTSELLSLDLATMTWKVESPHFSKHPSNQLTLNAVFCKPPNYLMLHRDYHTAAYINNKIILFGGRTPETKQYSESEFFEFDTILKKWRLIRATGYSPGPRNHLIAEVIGNYVIYFGGEATYQWENSFRNDVFVLNTGTYHCSQVIVGGSIPKGMCNMASCVCRGDLIICGGETISDLDVRAQTSYSQDIFILPLLPTLEVLCIDSIIQNNLSTIHLPPRLLKSISYFIEQ